MPPPIEHGEIERDGARLRFARWRPESEPTRGTLLLLHGRTEFLEKYAEVVEELLARRFAVWSMDWRGQGLSSRTLPNPNKGHVDRFETFLEDLDALVARLRASDDPTPLYVMGHSMGGHVALRYLRDRPTVFARAVLSAPMIDIAVPGGRAARPLVRALARAMVAAGGADRYLPGARDYSEVPFEGNALTNDPDRYLHERDAVRAVPELALGGPTFGWLDAAFRSVARLRDPAFLRAVRTPVLLCSAADDSVVCNQAQRAVCARLPFARFESIPGAKHEILKETDAVRAAFWRAFDEFIP